MARGSRAATCLCALLLSVALAPAWGCGNGAGEEPPPAGAFIDLVTFQPAALVLGQADFTSNLENRGGAAGANTTARTASAAAGSLYVADMTNHRVLGYLAPPAANGADADFVLGQPDFASNAPGTGAAQLRFPSHPRVFDGKLFLVDVSNHRVLVWNSLPTSNVPADVVVGQADFVSGLPGTDVDRLTQPSGLACAGGRLIVSDDLNSRVLIWNTVPTTNGAPADVVIGQPDFTCNAPNQAFPAPRANTLARPGGVWSDGTRLAVADAGNHRVLIWNAVPTVNDAPADIVLGQPDFASAASAAGAAGLHAPYDLDANGTQLFVADLGNNRILVWNAFPTANGAPADVVLGQADFANTAPNDDDQDGTPDALPSARTVNPVDFFYVRALGDRLYAGDHLNHRALIWFGN